jgi:hypothetical protein
MSLDLVDYRRRVFSIYTDVRNSTLSPEKSWANFRSRRDKLFSNHPQSALSEEQKRNFKALDYFPYQIEWRKEVELNFDVEEKNYDVELKEDGVFRMRRFAEANVNFKSIEQKLMIYWVMGYGGGLFLPFRDMRRESGETYGASRYLLDTIKGADLGFSKSKMILDFNYAYNPSCAYNPRWDCPLAPTENWLEIDISAGEKSFLLV